MTAASASLLQPASLGAALAVHSHKQYLYIYIYAVNNGAADAGTVNYQEGTVNEMGQ